MTQKTTRLRIVSDTHNEFGRFELPISKEDEKSILILAGDIGLISKMDWTIMDYLIDWADHFQDIIFVCGNHEHYSGSIDRGVEKLRDRIKFESLHNVHILDDSHMRIGDTTFIGSTMWSSFREHNPNVMNAAQYQMNDYRLIRTGPKSEPYKRKFTASDAYGRFTKAINYIFPQIKKEKEDGQKVVVITHMAPSYQSLNPKYATGPNAELNGAYMSDLDDDILEAKPNLMCHGHVHDSFDYMIGDTRVVCNPRGYTPHDINPNFDPDFSIDV